MANRRFPRNNFKNNGRNNFRGTPTNVPINCPLCCEQIPVLNDDKEYSLHCHLQSHKTLDSIDQDIDRQLSQRMFRPNVQKNVKSNYVCPECNENVQVFNNDVKRSLEMHAQKHQRPSIGTRGDDQSSTSSGRSRKSNRKQNYILDGTFNKMQPGLKAHRGFVYQNESEEVICRLCNLKIDSLNKIADHLVTKSHEDGTIAFIKSKLPFELHETMDFVSFYGSNLCCNLCRCKIDLSSLNLSETIMNIIAHNAGQQHINKKGRNEPLDRSKEGIKKLNFLASKDSLVNNNKHVISCEMQPQFKCKLCDKLITFDLNDQMLLKNFTSHFSSNGHNKCVRATSVLTTFKGTYQSKGDKHNLVVTKGSITCTVCSISMDPSLETLDAHVKETDTFPNIDWPEDLSARLDLKGSQQSFNLRDQNNKPTDNKVSKVNALLKCMPFPYRNVDYIVESSQGHVTCLICNCVIPATFYNLKTHLTGNSHMKNLSSTKDELGDGRLPNNNSTTTSAKSQNFNPFMKENSSPTLNAMSETINVMGNMLDYLKQSDPLIKRNLFLLTKHNDNLYSCSLCKITIPKSHDVESLKKHLITHLSGSNHMNLLDEKQNFELLKLQTVDPLVKANKQYLRRQGESLLCTLCDSPLSISADVIKMKKSLTEHLKGHQHQSKVEQITINQAAPTASAFKSKSEESSKDQYNFGKAFDFANSATHSSNLFQIPFEQFNGLKNPTKLEESTNRLQKPSYLLPNPSEPHRASEFANYASKSSSTFENPVEQFKGPQSPIKAEESTNRLQKSTYVLPNPTEPHRAREFANNDAAKASNMFQIPADQFKGLQNTKKPEESSTRSQTPFRELPISVKPNELSFELPKPVSKKATSTDLITELFHKLPANFQSDIDFIKKSGVVEGFLSCTLCNINHINPPYLQKHLEEEKHVQGRIGCRPPSAQENAQNSTSSKKMMQNMKNFFGFSN